MGILPGWDSITGSHWWGNFYFWASIISLIALGITEIASHRYSERESELSAIEQETTKKAHESEIARLRSQTIARRLEESQTTELIKAISPFKGQKVFILCSTAAWDATPFAEDFLNVFKQAGWEPIDQIRYGIVVGIDAIGIEVLVNPQMADVFGQVHMPSVITLINTLVTLNLMPSPSLGRMPEIDPGTIYIRIGRIPPPK